MVGKEQAIEIAKKQYAKTFELYCITKGIPDNCHILIREHWDTDSMWCVLCSVEGFKGLCSSHAIIICQYTGEILYDGSAYDEG